MCKYEIEKLRKEIQNEYEKMIQDLNDMKEFSHDMVQSMDNLNDNVSVLVVMFKEQVLPYLKKIDSQEKDTPGAYV